MAIYSVSSLFNIQLPFYKNAELLSDPSFSDGFAVISKIAENGIQQVEGNFTFNENSGTPSWCIAQWGKGPDLWTDRVKTVPFILTDGCCRKVEYFPEDNALLLSIDGTGAYGGKAADTEDFPHLLIEQSPFKINKENAEMFSCDSKHIVLTLDVKLNEYRETTNPDGINAVQLLSYFYVREKNGDGFIWFGINLFDDRGLQNEYWAIDTAGSNNMIYSLSTKETFGSAVSAKRFTKMNGGYSHIRLDFTPYIEKLIKKINEEQTFGHNVCREDLYISGMNLGFELHGNASCSATIKNLSLKSFRTDTNK